MGSEGVGKALISTESTTKTELFTLKRKEIAFFPLDAFRAVCHVLPRPAGRERQSSAIAFGTSEEHLRGLKFLPSEHLHQIYRRSDILDVRCEVGDPGLNVH